MAQCHISTKYLSVSKHRILKPQIAHVAAVDHLLLSSLYYFWTHEIGKIIKLKREREREEIHYTA